MTIEKCVNFSNSIYAPLTDDQMQRITSSKVLFTTHIIVTGLAGINAVATTVLTTLSAYLKHAPMHQLNGKYFNPKFIEQVRDMTSRFTVTGVRTALIFAIVFGITLKVHTVYLKSMTPENRLRLLGYLFLKPNESTFFKMEDHFVTAKKNTKGYSISKINHSPTQLPEGYVSVDELFARAQANQTFLSRLFG